MMEGGESPEYIARRLVRVASEDIGLADPMALPQAVAALQVLVAPVVFAAFQIETARNPSGTLCACLSAGGAACTDLSFV